MASANVSFGPLPTSAVVNGINVMKNNQNPLAINILPSIKSAFSKALCCDLQPRYINEKLTPINVSFITNNWVFSYTAQKHDK